MFSIKRFIRCLGVRSERKRLDEVHYQSRQFCYIHDYNGKACVWIHDIPMFAIDAENDFGANILDLKSAQDFVARTRQRFVKESGAKRI